METNSMRNVSKQGRAPKEDEKEKKLKDHAPKAKPEPITNWEAEGGAVLPTGEMPVIRKPEPSDEEGSQERREDDK